MAEPLNKGELVRFEAAERVDVPDALALSRQAGAQHELIVGNLFGQVAVLRGFDVRKNPGSATGIQVLKNAGALIAMDRGGADKPWPAGTDSSSFVFEVGGDATVDVDIAGNPAGAYFVFVKVDYVAARPDVRAFWAAPNGPEFTNTINTRWVPAWSVVVQPHADAAPVGAVRVGVIDWDGAALVNGDVYKAKMQFCEGTAVPNGSLVQVPPIGAFGGFLGPAFLPDFSRNDDRVTNGQTTLSGLLSAVLKCIEEIKDPHEGRWWKTPPYNLSLRAAQSVTLTIGQGTSLCKGNWNADTVAGGYYNITAALQTIAAAITGGSIPGPITILLKPGQYELTAPVTFNGEVSFVGTSKQATVLKFSGTGKLTWGVAVARGAFGAMRLVTDIETPLLAYAPGMDLDVFDLIDSSGTATAPVLLQASAAGNPATGRVSVRNVNAEYHAVVANARVNYGLVVLDSKLARIETGLADASAVTADVCVERSTVTSLLIHYAEERVVVQGCKLTHVKIDGQIGLIDPVFEGCVFYDTVAGATAHVVVDEISGPVGAGAGLFFRACSFDTAQSGFNVLEVGGVAAPEVLRLHFLDCRATGDFVLDCECTNDPDVGITARLDHVLVVGALSLSGQLGNVLLEHVVAENGCTITRNSVASTGGTCELYDSVFWPRGDASGVPDTLAETDTAFPLPRSLVVQKGVGVARNFESVVVERCELRGKVQDALDGNAPKSAVYLAAANSVIVRACRMLFSLSAATTTTWLPIRLHGRNVSCDDNRLRLDNRGAGAHSVPRFILMEQAGQNLTGNLTAEQTATFSFDGNVLECSHADGGTSQDAIIDSEVVLYDFRADAGETILLSYSRNRLVVVAADIDTKWAKAADAGDIVQVIGGLMDGNIVRDLSGFLTAMDAASVPLTKAVPAAGTPVFTFGDNVVL